MPLDQVDSGDDDASVTLLSRTPPSLPTSQRPDPKWPQIFSAKENRLNALRNWRWSWWSTWAELARFILPRRYHWLVVANRMNKGTALNDAIIDSTATQAMQICASGLWTGLTNPSRPWFKLGIGLPWINLDADGKAWLEDLEEKVYYVLGKSNFYDQLAQAFQDVATFGTAVILLYEDYEDVIRLYGPCAGEYFLGTGARLTVDVFYREYVFTTAQIVEEFGLENCSEDIRKAWFEGGTSLEREWIVAQAIEPNSPIQDRSTLRGKIQVAPSKFVFSDVSWLRGNSTPAPLRIRGFHEKPFVVMRWSTVSNDPYGRGPGQDSIGDTKQLQFETRRKAELIEKFVRPPMGAKPSLKNEPNSILPGHTTYTSDGKEGFFPLFIPPPAALTAITADIDKVAARIKDCFFVNFFMAITQMQGVQPRNELELTKRDLERLQALGPFIEKFETEVADPLLMRVINILDRRRLLKPKPASLRNVPIKISYVSIMRLAQTAAEGVSLQDFLRVGGALSEAAKSAGLPDPLRVINLDEALRRYGDLANVSPKVIYSEQQVKKMDAQRGQAALQQKKAQELMAGVQAAKTLSDTQVNSGTALGAMLGAPAGGEGA